MSIKRIFKDFVYRKYQKLDDCSSMKKECLQNVLNETRIQDTFLVLKGNIKLVNRGSISGVILAQEANIENYGCIEGVILSKNGVVRLKRASITKGLFFANNLSLQAGCIFNAELYSKNIDEFIEKAHERLTAKELEEVKRVVNAWRE